MANSSTMCQTYVADALEPVRQRYPYSQVYHYMDDLLLAHKNRNQLREAYAYLLKVLHVAGLYIAEDKVQGDIKTFLGTTISDTMVNPTKLVIRVDRLRTLNDFQKLGEIGFTPILESLPVLLVHCLIF